VSFLINTNIDAMSAQNYLSLNQMSYNTSVQRLSSGLRINSAADDAAGLAISQKLDAQVRGLNQASRNAQDGVSMVQTADGALGGVTNMLQRMRELAVEGSNGTLSPTDQANINTELQQLTAQINQISTQTKFNGLGLLDGSLSTTQSGGTAGAGFVIVAGTNTSITGVDVSQAAAGTTFTMTNASGVLTLADTSGHSQAITVGAVGANGTGTINFDKLGVKISVASVTGDTGANIAAGLTGKTVITAAGSGAANLQIGANASDSMSISFSKVDISASGLSGLNTALSTYNSTQNVANAQALITAVDGAIDTVNSQRASLGAYQNRLTDTVANLNQNSLNLATSESNIKDVNVASEMVNYTKTQILLQAGTAILAQANQAPNMVLKLLQ
jgi:flagellin